MTDEYTNYQLQNLYKGSITLGKMPSLPSYDKTQQSASLACE